MFLMMQIMEKIQTGVRNTTLLLCQGLKMSNHNYGTLVMTKPVVQNKKMPLLHFYRIVQMPNVRRRLHNRKIQLFPQEGNHAQLNMCTGQLF